MWQILDKKIIPLKYVDVIESMYDKAITSVRSSEGMQLSFYHYRFMLRVNIKSLSLCIGFG
jgi:hypothetical protein